MISVLIISLVIWANTSKEDCVSFFDKCLYYTNRTLVVILIVELVAIAISLAVIYATGSVDQVMNGAYSLFGV